MFEWLKGSNINTFGDSGCLKSNERGVYIQDNVIGPWLRRLPESTGGVLDLAAGQGIEAQFISEQGVPCTTIEPSAFLRKNSYYRHIKKGSVATLDFPPNSFGGVLLKDALIFISPNDREKMMSSVRRLLVGGGSFLIISELNSTLRIRYLPNGSQYPQSETYARKKVKDHWQEAIAETAKSGKIYGTEYEATVEGIMRLAQQYGFNISAYEYSVAHPIAQENRWVQKTGFVAEIH